MDVANVKKFVISYHTRKRLMLQYPTNLFIEGISLDQRIELVARRFMLRRRPHVCLSHTPRRADSEHHVIVRIEC